MGILNDNGSGFYMPVAPAAYGGNGGGLFGGTGGDIWGLLLVLLLAGNGMWGGFGGLGMGGMFPWMMGGMGAGFGMDYLYPWLNNSEHISGGFRDQQMASQLQGIQSAVTSGFGDVQLGIAGVNQNICQTGSGIVNALNNGFSGAEIAANGRQMANMQQAFAAQTAQAQGFNALQAQLAQCCCDNRLATNDVKYTIATEACANRAAGKDNTQAILDKLCQLELDGVKGELAAANNTISQLRTQLLVANNEASQVSQTGQIVDGIYNRLNNCPVSTTPVYGRQPIFTCQNNGCGCGCGNAFAA